MLTSAAFLKRETRESMNSVNNGYFVVILTKVEYIKSRLKMRRFKFDPICHPFVYDIWCIVITREKSSKPSMASPPPKNAGGTRKGRNTVFNGLVSDCERLTKDTLGVSVAENECQLRALRACSRIVSGRCSCDP